MKATSSTFKNSLAYCAAFCPSPKDYRNIVNSADSIVVVVVWNDEKDATLEVFGFNQTLFSSISALFPLNLLILLYQSSPLHYLIALNLDEDTTASWSCSTTSHQSPPPVSLPPPSKKFLMTFFSFPTHTLLSLSTTTGTTTLLAATTSLMY